MTISAITRAADSDRLDRMLDLYRDLTVALSDRIAQLKTTATHSDFDCKKLENDLASHRKLMQSVFDLEASLGKCRQRGDGESVELDLGAARTEILARLAHWAAGG